MSPFLAVTWTVVLVLVSLVDLRHQVIPSLVIYPALALAVLAAPFHPQGGWNALAGGLACGGVLLGAWLLARLLGRPAVGWGDVELAAFTGLALGLPQALAALLVGHLLAGLIGIALFLHSRRRTIPLGPFLSAGTLWWLWDGPRLLHIIEEWWHAG